MAMSLTSLISSAWSAVKGRASWIGYAAAALAVALALVCWGMWQRADARAEQDRSNAEQALTAYRGAQASLERLAELRARQDASLAQREQDIQTIRAERDALAARKSQAVRHDPSYADWRAAPTPDAVRRLHQ